MLMAKTQSGGKGERPDAEEKSEGLEIISIGSLYKGAWEKKYWTTSRGKDRYPYPVGYQAVRAYNGITYKMEISEGVNGPRFLISSDDGSLASGKTPDQAWEEFQKKGCPRIKIWHGKRLSSKMDGLELFGFKNQFIQRLLWELVRDINGIAEQSFVSSNASDRVIRTEPDDCCPNAGSYPDLLLCLGKPHVTGERSRCKFKNKRINVQTRPQSPDFTCSRPSNVKNDDSLGQGSSTTDYVSEVLEVQNQISVPAPLHRITSNCRSNNCISSKNELLLNPIEIFDDKKVEAVPSKGLTGFLNSENHNTTELTEKLSTEEPCIADNAPDCAPTELDKNAYNETFQKADLFITEHEEAHKFSSNQSSEKTGFVSAGQDVAKSMMSLLVPQAVPLMRNVSTNKGFTISTSDMMLSQGNFKDEQNKIGCSLNVPSSDVIMTETAHEEQGEEIHGYTDLHSNTPNYEHMKSVIVPDSFEYSQCDDYKTNQEILSSAIAEAGRSSLIKEMCSQELLAYDLPNGTSSCHASGLDYKGRPQNCDVCIPESVLDMSPRDLIISERSDDGCSDYKENLAHVGLSSMQKDLPAAQDFTGGARNAFSGVKTKSCQLESIETFTEKTQDKVMGKTGNAETLIMSSKLPKFVYSRKKLRSATSFQENGSVMECTEYDKFELVTPEVYTAKPSSQIILINSSNDKPREPHDTVGLCEETPQTCSDVLGGRSNLVEPNETSSQHPTPFNDESKCVGTKEAPFISEPMPLQNQEIKNNLGRSVTFVGRYLHPMPVSSLFLSTKEDEIHVCVLCGELTDQYRTLFTYKVAISGKSLGCPSVMAHSLIRLTDPKHNFIKDTMVERFGVQLTPDGQYIVLIGSIQTPNCREGKIDCYCSTCTSVFSEKNALKIVQVEHGYVSVVTTLETLDNVHCILVCEPNQLVSVGESGRLQVWVMNSTWSEKIEHFSIPADGCVSPGIVELKRVPKCTRLVVGRNSFGEFSLWDIAKRDCVTSFPALESPINEFFPISLFRWQTKDSEFSDVREAGQADKLLESTNLWYTEQRETCWFSLSEEDVAMWFFVSTITDLDCCHNHVSNSSSYDTHTARNWRLALLMKNSITFGSPLDPRTTGIGVSCGYGIIGTSDGVVYMWELSKGSKIGTLHHFQDGNVTCVATDDSGGAFGVAGGGGQLLLYLHHPELDSN